MRFAKPENEVQELQLIILGSIIMGLKDQGAAIDMIVQY